MLQVLVNVSLENFNCRKEAWAMQELFIKEKRESIEKMDKCPRY